MNLIERLQYHINKLHEGQSGYMQVKSPTRSELVDVWIDPTPNEFQNLLKEYRPDGMRGLYHKGSWYFWWTYGCLHETVAKKIGLTGAINIISSSVEITNHNTLLTDNYEKISELQNEMEPKEFRVFLAKTWLTLKKLNQTYHTDNLNNIKKDIVAYLKPIEEYDPMQSMNKQQRHEYRKNKREETNRWVSDLNIPFI